MPWTMGERKPEACTLRSKATSNVASRRTAVPLGIRPADSSKHNLRNANGLRMPFRFFGHIFSPLFSSMTFSVSLEFPNAVRCTRTIHKGRNTGLF